MSCFQLQQEKCRLGLFDFLKNLYLFMSWDRIEPPCLFCMLTPWKLLLCSHPNLGDFQSFMQSFPPWIRSGLVTRVWKVSIEWKWNRSIFMTSISTIEILMAFPYFVPTFLYRGFSIHSKPSSRKEFWIHSLLYFCNFHYF